MKRLEKKLGVNYTRILCAVFNKLPQAPVRSLAFRLTKHPSKHTGHCWESKDEIISNVLLWTSTHGHISVGRPANIHIRRLCADTGCSLENPRKMMDDRNGWREKESARERETEGQGTLGYQHELIRIL